MKFDATTSAAPTVLVLFLATSSRSLVYARARGGLSCKAPFAGLFWARRGG